ncbi:plasmid maintenance protein [Borreliella americana]|uniref:plasmid maintenance protein n=1 Tax=Borreliella americana TaxID=478807 RepID=UPI001E2CCF2D|nr:plasmid maintenance protein [Borreliella americana]MCD2382036.1 plasmid maintenance protein [Borreliella americana]
MKAIISNYKYQINTNRSNKLLPKDYKLKKIISVIIYLNKEFEKKYNLSIHRIHFNSEKIKELRVHHQVDILRVLNSNIDKENKKETTINTLRTDLRFLIKLKALEKKIITFSNNFGEFKGKLCIYKVSPIAHKLIDAHFNSTKEYLIKKVKEEKKSFKPQNITENITVYNKSNINIHNKNSTERSFFKKIKSIISNTKEPIKTLKNSLLNYKDFKNYLKYDYDTKDIKEFFLFKLNLYKNKIHFMRKIAPYKTDFYTLAGEFKDTYNTKWKTNKTINFSGHAGILANSILENILTKELKFE